MLNMSDQFYSYLSNKLFNYFENNKLKKGDKFYIQFDEKDEILDFYESIKEYAIDNHSFEEFSYKHEKGDEFDTFSITCGDLKLVIVESVSISEDYLVTLRNQVGSQKGVWENTALLIIYDEAKDSIFNGMGNLANDGMPLNINYISKNLEDEISSSKNLEKSSKEIIRFSLKNLKEDIFQTTIWDYKNILSIIKSEKITPEDLFELKLFPDKNLGDYNAHKMQSRLKDNHDLFDEIENSRKYGDVKEELKKSFSDKGVKALSNDDWFLNDYKDVKDFKKKGKIKPLGYEENHEKITNEGLTYWEKPVSSTPAGLRKRDIIIFNDDNQERVSFSLSFDQRTKTDFLSKEAKRFVSTAGMKLKIDLPVSENKPTIRQISYKHNNQNNSHYIFNLLVLNSSSDIFDSIKSRYTIAYKKKSFVITNDEDSDEVIFGIGSNKIEKEIEDTNEKVFLFDEDSIVISEASPAWDEGSLKFELVYNENFIPIEITEKSKKPVPVKSSVIWNLKRQNKENFTFNGVKAIQGVNSVYLEDKFKEYLGFESQIIENNIFYGKKEIDGTIKKQELEFSDELTEAYNAIFNYYKTFDDTPEDNLPSLVYLNNELKGLYENFLNIFNKEISEINNNEVLADYPNKKDLIKLGRIDDDKRIMYSSLSPINIAYQLEILNQCGDDNLSNNLAERLVPNNLIPYIYSDLNELYRPIFQEHAHEWLIYEKSEDVSIGTTNAFISNVVSEKLNQFVKHFDYLFEINNNSPLKINLININDDVEVVKGVFSFIRDRLPDKVKTKAIIPVEINIYNDSDKSSFETLFNCSSKEDVQNLFGITIKSDLLDEIDILHMVQNNISYYHNSINDDYEYAHLSFYKITSDIEPVYDNMDKMETGLSLNGLISSVASTTKHSDYRTGFGIKNVLDKENVLVKSAININELIENSKNHGKNSYSKNRAVFTSITLNDDNLEELYKNSHWVTFIEPTFGIEYFDNSNDLVIIHYSDQFTSSNKYDTITVTYKSTHYKHVIKKFLKEKGVNVNDDELNGIIRMFNSINGEWLLKIVSSSGEFDREKLSLISAAKYMMVLLDHKDILWIPISLEEILRITRNLKLDKSKGPISMFVKQGSYSDDLLFIGLKLKDDETIEVIYHPVEVKIGLNDSSVIKKGKSQIESTYNLLYDLLNGNTSNFVNKFFRNFFIQLFLSNQQKLIVNEIWDEKGLEKIERFKAKLLNDDYTVIYNLEEFIGKGSLVSFKTDCHFQSITKYENKQIIELPEEFAYDSLAKSVNDLYLEIQSGNTEFPVDDLLSHVDLTDIKQNLHEYIDDSTESINEIVDSGIVDDYLETAGEDGFDELDVVDSGIVDDYLESEDEHYNHINLDESLEESKSRLTPGNIESHKAISESQDSSPSIDLKDVRGLIGTVEGSNHEVYWEFGAPELNNRHILIQGASGYGKSYFIQKMLKELSNQGIPSIIIDYTDGFKKSKLEYEFKESLGDKIEQHKVLFNKFPLNPFKKYLIEDDEDFVPETDVSVAGRFKNIINTVYNFGDQQQMAIYNATISGLSKYGDEMDLIKFKEELIKQDSSPANTTLNKLTQFLDINPFKTEDFDWSYLDNSDGKVMIIQLTGLSRDIQRIVSEFILWDLWNYKLNTGEQDNPFIVVLDEAQNLDFGEDSPCGKILVEGRKFGWSGWFATQFLKGAMKSDEINRLENASEKIYFHPNENSISDIAGNLSKDNNDKKYWEQKLSQLNKGQCIVHGHLRNSSGDVYSGKPVCVDISRIGIDKFESKTIDNDKILKEDQIEISSNKKLIDKNTKFIKKYADKFEIIKTINGERLSFGTFDTLDEAIKRRDELIADNWGYSTTDDLPAPGKKPKYAKYIIFKDGFFKVSKSLEGQQWYLGTFKTLDEAIELRDFLIKHNWDLSLLPSDMFEDKRVHNIRKIKNRYIVANSENGEKSYYGSFDTYEEAKEYLDWLIENNWDDSQQFEEEKIDEFIYLIGDEYLVRNEIDGELKIFGKFEDMAEAIKFRNQCVKTNWKLDESNEKNEINDLESIIFLNDESNENLIKDNVTDYHIKYHEGFFKIFAVINDKNVRIGLFNSVSDAKKLEEFLINNNWDLTKLSEDILIEYE